MQRVMRHVSPPIQFWEFQVRRYNKSMRLLLSGPASPPSAGAVVASFPYVVSGDLSSPCRSRSRQQGDVGRLHDSGRPLPDRADVRSHSGPAAPAEAKVKPAFEEGVSVIGEMLASGRRIEECLLDFRR